MKQNFFKHLGAMVLLLFASLGASAQNSTTDRFVVSSSGFDDEFGNYFMVGLEGEHKYCAYNLTITLPKCVSFYMEDGEIGVIMNDDFYPKTMGKFSHTVIGALQADPKQARVACTSNKNAEFKATSGDLFFVLYNYNAWAKAGANEIRMTGLNLTTKEAVKYVPEGDLNLGEIEIPAEREVSISISKEAKIGTCILPFAKSDLPEGVKAYESAGIEDGVLSLNPVETLEAYKPYILFAPNGFSGKWSGIADASAFPESGVAEYNGLCGVIEQTSVTAGYILQLQEGDEVAQFYRVGDTPFSLNPGRCYLSNVSSPAKALRIRFNDESGISFVHDASPASSEFYNLAGQRVPANAPGTKILINKGKKIVKN